MKDVTKEEFYKFLETKEYEIVLGRFVDSITCIEKGTMNLLAYYVPIANSTLEIFRIIK